MPTPLLTQPSVGYMLGCKVERTGPPPPPRAATENTDLAWWATFTWSAQFGGTTAIAGPFTSRREAVLGMREHLKERRVAARLAAAALIERRGRWHHA